LKNQPFDCDRVAVSLSGMGALLGSSTPISALSRVGGWKINEEKYRVY
jgi:hypothetical protein